MTVDDGGGASRSTDPASGSSAATDVSLREYLTDKIAANQRLNGERLKFFAVIGCVVWFFIERHMSDLNHENARLKHQQDSTVSADTYSANEQQRDKEREELGDWRKTIDRAGTQSVSREEFQRDTRTEKRASSSFGWQWVGGVVGLVLAAITLYTFVSLHHITVQPAPTQVVTVTVPSSAGSP